ncbi:uncharacterized protein LOC124369057 [Homalodisca vitripennis]|uniref:uncharacterized protein LOC124369057 n=1 Tax=Homalodisca vitripennis TaxID=197043 RepID=UPI001EEC05CF|nr:uncharacterized protein LOC124369057 [Homalodisca vitripennis]XP_046682716.1 uncharacterized protein LOC124369057 [Homalodisca vitripennis]
MERRNLILTAIFSTLGVVLVLAVAFYVFLWCHKHRRKRNDAVDSEDGARMEVTVHKEKESRNGFLSFKTPLISTKTLG